MDRKKDSARKIRFTDTSLRDAHQSLWATRMRTDDILAIAETVDGAGYYSLECWGGATFDVCLRFLRENPWERLRRIKEVCRKTPLQMLLRGQNALGYKHYPDDVVDRCVALACENGMDIFRVFDALNDPRNLETAMKAVKKYGAHAQGTISYTVSPVHTVEKYVKLARDLASLGADSICIKDMAGILTPGAARALVSAICAALPEMPVQVHSHATSGMAAAMYLAAVEAGAGCIDTAVSTLSSFSSQPPAESMLAILESEGYATDLDLKAVGKENAYFRELKSKRQPASSRKVEPVDAGVLVHNIPGGMISNLRSQLAQQDALDRLDEVLEELPRVRKDLGYPPLVTPTSQIVGVQSVMNVLSGERYGVVPQETRLYAAGYYGRTPAPIDAKLRKKLVGKEIKPIDCRPADLLKPGLAAAAKELDPSLIKAEEDIISYCMFPEVALGYFKWRAKPEGERDPIPADAEEAQSASAPAEKPAADPAEKAFADLGRALAGLVRASLGGEIPANAAALPAAPVPAPSSAAAETEKAASQDAGGTLPAGTPVTAPLNGTFYRSAGPGKPEVAKEGDTVKAGDPVSIVEAMKLFNTIKAPCSGKILKFTAVHGSAVQKGATLAIIG